MATSSAARTATFDQPPLRRDGLLWPALLVAASLVGSLAFTCATPFAAFAVIMARTMSTRTGVATLVLIWAVNQAVGFLALSYPWTVETALWGAALGTAAAGAWLVAASILRRGWAAGWVGLPVAFAAAFLVFELVLAGAALGLGGLEAFAPAVVAEVLEIAIVWLVALQATHLLLTHGGGLAVRWRGDAARTAG